MKLVVAKFRTHREADEATREYYRKLSPAERLQVLFDLRSIPHGRSAHGRGAQTQEDDAASERLARVYRIAQLKRG